MQQETYQRIVATIILVLLGILLLIAVFPYKNAFFGAFILYVLFHPMYSWLRKKKEFSPKKATWTIILTTLFIVLIPLMLVLPVAISQVSDVVSQKDAILEMVHAIDVKIPQYNVTDSLEAFLNEMVRFIQSELGSFIGGATDFFVTIVMMYFLLYYLYIHTKKISKIKKLLPFSTKHTKLLLNEFSQVSKATIYTTGIIAVVQGVLLGIGLYFAGVPGSLFLGILSIIFSFIPIIGIPIIWIPSSIYLVVTQHYVAAIFILVLGIILSNLDNFIRPALQNKIGKIHPLVSLIGVFIGLPLFGILGIVIGPLLISYFFLILDIYMQDYVTKE